MAMKLISIEGQIKVPDNKKEDFDYAVEVENAIEKMCKEHGWKWEAENVSDDSPD